MDAVLRDGTTIVPGDKVMVLSPPRRMWGGRVREDTKAEPIKVSGTVMSVTFERDFETNELNWHADVAIKVPIMDPDSGDARLRVYDTSLTVKPEQFVCVLKHMEETEAFLCGKS